MPTSSKKNKRVQIPIELTKYEQSGPGCPVCFIYLHSSASREMNPNFGAILVSANARSSSLCFVHRYRHDSASRQNLVNSIWRTVSGKADRATPQSVAQLALQHPIPIASHFPPPPSGPSSQYDRKTHIATINHNMSSRYAFSSGLRELRFLFCQSSPPSRATR